MDLTISFLAIFTASLLGSPHCAAMCGGFVTFYAGNGAKSIGAHASYHLGRLLTYTSLGLAAGIIGSQINRAGTVLGAQRVAALILGAAFIAWGFGTLLKLKLITQLKTGFSRLLAPLHKRSLALIASERGNIAAFLIGTISTLLPCGWLYGYVALAAASGSVVAALLIMFCFWLGTVPILLGIGGAAQSIGARFARHRPILAGVFFIIAGFFSIFAHFETQLSNSSECHDHGSHHGHLLLERKNPE